MNFACTRLGGLKRVKRQGSRRVHRLGAMLLQTGVLVLVANEVEAASSTRVYYENGRLQSEADDATNRIPDFSHAGYRGGGVELPDVAEVVAVEPIVGDNTMHLQLAIDQVAEMVPGPDGFRGAVVLAPGLYEVAGTIRIHTDGIVLRGAGDSSDPAQGSIIRRVGTAEEPVVRLGGEGNTRWKNELPDSRSDITSSFVQVGSAAFEVADPQKYAVGDNIIVYHPCTDDWLASKEYGATGSEAPWPEGGYPLVFNRVITAIDGTMIHLDAPVFDHLDRDLAQSSIYKLDRNGIVSNVGLEDFRVEIESDLVMHAVTFDHVENGFAVGLTVRDFLLGGIHMTTAKHLTIRNVRAVDPKGPTIGGRKYNFMAASAQLVLVEDSYARAGRHSFVSNGTSWDSGVVFLRGVADGSLSPSEGHHRWSMGLLYDGHTETNVDYDGILLGLYNRGDYGTGHGWATAHSVAWNCDLAGGKGVVQQPPGAQNHAIGCSGQISGDGPFDHPPGFIEQTGQPVEPDSLYEAQLADREQNPPDDGSPPPGYMWESIQPVADAFVRAGMYATENYGGDELLTVKAGNPDFTREVFLSFDVSNIPPGALAQLRLRQRGLGVGGMRYAIATVSESWDEQSITYANQPGSESPSVYWFPEQTGFSSVDVTAQVESAKNADTHLSLKIWATKYYGGPGFASFVSREGEAGLQPEIVYAVPDPEEETTSTTDDPGTSTGDTSGTTEDSATGDPETTGDQSTTSSTTAGPSGSSGSDSMSDTTGSSDGGAGCGCRTGGANRTSMFYALAIGLGFCRRRHKDRGLA